MRFAVPQFIEHQAKIIGPMTFGQFIYVAVAGGVCFILYFIIPFSFFIGACVVILGGAGALAFLKINGRELPSVLGSFLKFNFMPKMYIWKKKDVPIKRMETKISSEEELSLEVSGGQLKKIKTKIESGTK
jgi:hypothetical protein